MNASKDNGDCRSRNRIFLVLHSNERFEAISDLHKLSHNRNIKKLRFM